MRDTAAIRQLATHTDSVSSEQVDNIRRMLLAMVDDFRCVVIKLASVSRICARSKTRAGR
ncbi:HD domain-containing protein [Klebsiella pneumoniae subsp. pneumoniae]|nr:HD domain-containing protein [Klebsiella pneumoniae subsp. pneumoniae]